MKTNRTILFAAAALFAVTAVSCNKEENGNNGEETVYTLELADPEQAEIILENDETAPFTVELNTNLSKDQLSVTENDDKTWCSALIDDDCNISILPGENTTTENLTATFTVSAKGVDGVSPIEFSITLKHPVFTLSIESEDLTYDDMMGMYSYTGDGNITALIVTVKTNAPLWYVSDMSMSDDWCILSTGSGKDNDQLYINLKENSTGSTRAAQLMFTYEEESYNGVMVMIMQNSLNVSGASYVTVYKDNQKITTDYPISISAGEAESTEHGTIMRVDYMEEFSYTSDGAIDFKYYEAGTDTDITEEWYETGWVWASPDMEDDSKFTISCQQGNSGAARSVDIVIVPAGGTDELFRFKVTQAGA